MVGYSYGEPPSDVTLYFKTKIGRRRHRSVLYIQNVYNCWLLMRFLSCKQAVCPHPILCMQSRLPRLPVTFRQRRQWSRVLGWMNVLKCIWQVQHNLRICWCTRENTALVRCKHSNSWGMHWSVGRKIGTFVFGSLNYLWSLGMSKLKSQT